MLEAIDKLLGILPDSSASLPTGKGRPGRGRRPQAMPGEKTLHCACPARDRANWVNRPFCRENTQSEPDDPPGEASSEDEPECLRCCTDYYYSGKRKSAEIIPPGRERRDGSSSHRFDSDSESEEGGAEEVRPSPSLGAELAEGLGLFFLVALPMLARQLGSIVSRRLLTRLLGRFSPYSQ